MTTTTVHTTTTGPAAPVRRPVLAQDHLTLSALRTALDLHTGRTAR